ncbi:hypothetical protein B0O99DRAFT_716169 [Bisporella sp. PMI_857]|nr:hypothetical protein B0O99DRAFT_716169 [Bisporella sp. PMI_857]
METTLMTDHILIINFISSDGTILVLEPPALETRPLPPILEPDLDPTSPQQPHSIVWNTTFAPNQDGVFDHQASSPGTLGRKSKREIENSDIFTLNNVTSRNLVPRASATLRILCLGASITWGDGSSHGNGYQWGLRSALFGAGYTVDMIGSVNQGNMADNQVEGWPGAVISGVAQKAELSLPSRSNIVIIQVGSNDMTLNIDPAAALRLAEETYNPGLLQMVKDKNAKNKNVWFIDMNNGYITLDDLANGLHPNDAGYMKMARLYYDAIVDLNYYIKPIQAIAGINDAAAPPDIGGGEIDTKCQKVPGNGGNGDDDYIFVSASGDFTLFGNLQSPPAWQQYGIIYHRALTSRKQLHFADWNGDGRCDILIVDKDDGHVLMARNDGCVNGKLSFYEYGLVSSTAKCSQGYRIGHRDFGVRFAYISGNPRMDYLKVSQRPAREDTLGKPNANRCTLHSRIEKNGRTTGYINCGINDMVYVGQIKAPAGADRGNVRFADVNGDVDMDKDDFLWIDKFTGKTTAWTKACSEGQKNAIKQAYKEFHKIADTEAIKSGTNWNEAATLEVFGPYGIV